MAAPQQPQQYPPQQYAPQQQYAPPPGQQQYAQPPGQQYAPPPQQQAPYPPPPYAQYAPQPAHGINLPPWLMSIGFAVLFLAVGAGLFFGIRYLSSGNPASASAPASDNTPAPSSSKPQASALQKYVEVIGLRLIEDPKKKPQVRFVVVNHSGAEMGDLTASVNLWARTAKSDEEAIGTFSFSVPSLGAYESKEMSSALNTKLRVYELPDWQNLVAEVQITSPK